jgi:MFS family permease
VRAQSRSNHEFFRTETTPTEPTAEGVEGDGLGGASTTTPGTMEGKSSSTWFALRNPVFRRLWLATLLSGTFVSSQDVTATWLMDYLGASPYLLSLLATAASAPFFLFTLPAGAIADIVNRRTVIVSAVLWQAAWSVILALGALWYVSVIASVRHAASTASAAS